MATPSGLDGQIGVATGVTWGTRVPSTRFFPFVPPETWTLAQERIRSASMTVGSRTHRSDNVVLGRKVVSSEMKFEVHNKNSAFWLVHMLGTVATTGAGDPYTHTGTEGSLTGDFFSCQVGVPDKTGTVQRKNIASAKCTGWSLELSNQGLLVLTIRAVGNDMEHTTALDAASIATSELLSFATGSATMGGSAIRITNFKLDCDLGLDTQRWAIQNSTKIDEPLESGMRSYTGQLEMEFESLTEINRYVTGAPAQAILTCTDAGGTHEWKVTIPKVHYSGTTPQVTGATVLKQSLPFTVEYDGTNSPVTIAVKTADATP